MLAKAAELRIADVHTPEEGAGRGVVGPDLLLVLKGGLPGVAIYDHGRLPVAGVEDARRRRVIEPRHADAEEAMELGVRKRKPGWPRTHEVGVVQPRAVVPRERAVLVDRAERQRG